MVTQLANKLPAFYQT